MIVESLVAAHIATAAATTVLYIDSNDKQQTINKLTEQLNTNTKQLRINTSAIETNQKALLYIVEKKK